MTISNTILKTLDRKTGVILSSTDDKRVYRFFAKVLGKDKVYGLDDAEFLYRPVHALICVNKIETIEKSLKLAHYLHIPIIIYDISPKPDFMSVKKISPPNITYLQLALNQQVAKSWDIDSYHDIVDIDISNPESIKKWETIFTNISNTVFNVNTEPEKNKEYEQQKYSFNY